MYWGVDLGGTKIECAVLDEQHQVLARKRVPTEAAKGMQHIISQIGLAIDLCRTETGSSPKQLGIGTPGSVDPQTGLLKNSNTQAINNQPFYSELQKALSIPVKIANDANCFALAEAQMGAVKDQYPDASVVFGVIMGTGTGGGIVIDGKVLNGRHGIGGEWGHAHLDASGGKCYCGDTGCTERILAGPSLERFYEEQSGVKRSLKDIYAAYNAGTDEVANQTMERLIHFFGLGLSNIINVLDPDVIVLGGGVSNLDILYTLGVESVKKHVFNPSFHTPIIKPKLGDSAGVFGAALL
ncbi:ROK family protein [Marinoscillum furvescens]|uniref:N-acetylglucosamine kinase n=1 Tax=Marinoscillum furvescens DSM 4134 TaxID=1122208 RepID=A0A3D9KZC3_MARFU|nr:ROK family protein [Marinoscillum furvescens]RED95640.1 N-acetylglucosamine kinase [Marinoscillum furvescens DSM 4134]